MDVNLHYYWIERGVTVWHAEAIRSVAPSFQIHGRVLVVYAQYPEFNIDIDDLARFADLGRVVQRVLEKARNWRRAEIVNGVLTLEGCLVDFAPHPLLSDALKQLLQ